MNKEAEAELDRLSDIVSESEDRDYGIPLSIVEKYLRAAMEWAYRDAMQVAEDAECDNKPNAIRWYIEQRMTGAKEGR